MYVCADYRNGLVVILSETQCAQATSGCSCDGRVKVPTRWYNVVSQEPPYMEGQFVVVKDAKRTSDAEVLCAGTFVVIIVTGFEKILLMGFFCEN